MVQIKWTQLASEDLKGIYEFIARDSLKYAKIEVIKLKARTHILRTIPSAGREVPELKNKIYRELIEGNYRIIYKTIDSINIDILTIHHSARDLSIREIEY
jgi:plasmid stabilization system protein ParE